MQDKVVYLTPEGKQRFTAELHELLTVRRHQVEDQIRRAKEFSDTVDNAEYDGAQTAFARHASINWRASKARACAATRRRPRGPTGPRRSTVASTRSKASARASAGGSGSSKSSAATWSSST